MLSRPINFQIGLVYFLKPGRMSLPINYLSVPQLQITLKKWYIPVALFIATSGPLVENFILQQAFPTILMQTRGESVVLDPGYSRLFHMVSQLHLVFSLFIPLIFISWQYSLRMVITILPGFGHNRFISCHLVEQWSNAPRSSITFRIPGSFHGFLTGRVHHQPPFD
jgi:hypothetical protein